MNTAPRKNRGSLPKTISPRVALALSAIMAVSAHAQTPATPPAADEEVVKLNPFVVNTEKDSGYRTSNSIAGTRSNVAIRDLATNIQVLTQELASDVLATSHVDLERYNAAVINGNPDQHSDNTIQQSYNAFLFRGFTQNWGLRDGIRLYDPVDIQGIERVEVIKGPAAVFYGVSYAGGVMNTITKDVNWLRNATSIKATVQTEGQYRGSIDTNVVGKIGDGHFGIRFNGAYAETQDYRAHSEGSQKYSQINLGWKPFAGTELKLLVQDGHREKPVGLGIYTVSGAGSSSVPLQITNPSIPWDWNWADGNMRTSSTSLIRGSFVQTINKDFIITGYWQAEDRQNIDSDGWNDGGNSLSSASWDVAPASGWRDPNTPAQVIRKAFHHRSWNNNVHGYGLTALYRFDMGEVKNTFTAGANARGDKFHSYRGNQPSNTTSYIEFPVRANIAINAPRIAPADYNIRFWQSENNSEDYYFANWHGSFLENKLKANVGVNKTNYQLIPTSEGGGPVNSTTHPSKSASKTSPMFGLVYDVTKDISVFAVHSTSIFASTNKDSFERFLDAEIGKGDEVGVKLDAFDGKISGTISLYKIENKGVRAADPNKTNANQALWDTLTPQQRIDRWGSTTTRADLRGRDNVVGDYTSGATAESKGFEIDLVIQPFKNWQTILSFAHNSNEIVESTAAGLIGQSTQGSIKNQLSILSKYNFTEGSVKGLSVGLGLAHAGKALQEYQGTVARYNPSTLYAEMFASYGFKAYGWNHKVQLNVRNITEQEEYIGWVPKAGGALATDRYEVPTKKVISLTYGIDF